MPEAHSEDVRWTRVGVVVSSDKTEMIAPRSRRA